MALTASRDIGGGSGQNIGAVELTLHTPSAMLCVVQISPRSRTCWSTRDRVQQFGRFAYQGTSEGEYMSMIPSCICNMYVLLFHISPIPDLVAFQ